MSRSVLPFLLLAFVLGGAVGFVIGRQAEEPALNGGAPSAAPEDSTRTSGPDRERIPRAADSSDEPIDLERMVRGADPVPEESGTGRITGKVVDEVGRPLAGVVVRAVSRGYYRRRNRPKPNDGSPPPKTSLLEEARWLVDNELRRRAALYETASAADGSFAFENLADREYGLTAYRVGMKFTAQGGAGWITPDRTIVLVASPLAMVEIQIVGPDGEPVQEAHLTCRKTNTTTSRTWLPDRPVVYLDFAEWSIWAHGGPQKILASEKKIVTLTPETSPQSLVLALKPRSGISGTVVFPPDEHGASTAVKAVPEGAGEDEGGHHGIVRSARADAGRGGKFLLLDLLPGRWLVSTPGRAAQTVTVGEGLTEVELVAPEPGPEICVEVVVLSPGGEPLPGVSISGNVSGEGRSMGGGGRTALLAAGRYRYYFSTSPHWTTEDIAEGRVRRSVSVTLKRYGSKSLEVLPGTREVEIRFEEAAKLVVTVEGWGKSEGSQALKVGVTTGRVRGTNMGGRRPNANGVIEFGPQVPGEYTVYLSGPLGEDDRVAFEKRKVTLSSGENRVVFQVPALYTITAVVEGGEDCNFELAAGDNSWDTFPAETEKGEISWRVPGGEYEVRPWGGNLEPKKRVRVPGDKRVVFRKMKPDCFEVQIKGPGRFAAAGHMNGDLIVGIDGESFKNRSQMWALRTLARERERVTLTVLRGAREVKLEVPGSVFRGSAKENGGRIELAMR